ncbi:MAG: hypothetical protein NW200_04975 [Hyphomonadaceae bacterium]|nr:hypothetical protein [Hyphomonadaceae bacterium]
MDLRTLAARVLPPVSRTVRTEEAKLSASLVNAVAIAALIYGILGPYITTIPDAEWSLGLRAFLIALGGVIHLAARLILRYIDGGRDDDA